jgi:glycosyltransferase involved in cell wall biosynthesis
MKVIPFLDKNDEKQREELNNLFVVSDFMLFLTRNDCTPIVFCESSAFGLPVITTNTGSLSGGIQDDSNGFMLPLSARGAESTARIVEVYSDDQRYDRLVQSSRAAFDDILNWDVWGVRYRNY